MLKDSLFPPRLAVLTSDLRSGIEWEPLKPNWTRCSNH